MTDAAPAPCDVFLSYAREDRDTARRLAAALTRARGWSVWWDAELRSGELFNRRIEQIVAATRCVIVLWSRHSAQSDWVVAEATEGWERGVLVPVLLDSCQPPLPFRQVQAADLADWRGSIRATAFLGLLEDVQRVMAQGSAVGNAELAARERRRRRLQQRRWARRSGVIAVLLALAAVAWSAWRFQQAATHADAIAAESTRLRNALLQDYDATNRTWWAYIFESRDHSRQLEVIALLAAEAYDRAKTPVTKAALADAWALLPWTDKGRQFPSDDWHSSLDFSHDGRFLAGGGGASGSVIWDIDNDQIAARIPHGGLAPTTAGKSTPANRGEDALDFSPVENTLATAGPDPTARLWNSSGEELARLPHDSPVTAVRFSPDGTLLAATDENGGVVLWDVRTRQIRHRLTHTAPARGPEFSPGSRYIGAVASDGNAAVWDVSSGAPVASFQFDADWRGNSVDGIAFSPDEATAVTFGDVTPTVFHALPSGKELWRDPNGSYAGVVFSSNGDTAVIGGVDLAWWDTATRQLKFSIEQASVTGIRATSNGQFIGTVSTGDNVQVWDFASGREVKRIPMYRWLPSLAFSADGTTLAVGGLDEFRDARVLEVIDLLPESLRIQICGGISANFSRNEWRSFFAQTPYRATCPERDEFE